MHEALERMWCQTFLGSLPGVKRKDIEEYMAMLKDLHPGFQFQELLKATGLDNIVTEYRIFIETYKATRPTFSLWSSYIDITGAVYV